MLQRHPIKGCTPNRPGGSSSTYGCRTSCQLGWPLHCGHRTGGRSSSMHELSYWRTRSPDVWRIFMKFLGFQTPNYTFPGVTNDRLFDHVAMLANTAERAGVDLERHCEAVGRDPRTIVKTRLGSLIIGKTDAEAERLYWITEAAEKLGVSPATIATWIRLGIARASRQDELGRNSYTNADLVEMERRFQERQARKRAGESPAR